MKKSVKILIATILTSAVASSAALLSGCFVSNNYDGEYHYSSWGHEYGMKVSVEIQSDDKGDRIRKVEVLDSDYISVSDANDERGWTQAMVDNWNNNLDSLLLEYRGRYIMDVLEEIVVCNEGGVPSSVSDSSLVISGATQGSGRLALAVQDAIESAISDLGYAAVDGDYHYTNAYGSQYGMKVRVFVKDGKIFGVKKLASEYVEVSSANPNYGWTQAMVNNWNNKLVGLLKAYNGKTVAEIKAITVATDSIGQPSSVGDDDFVITGATQGSGRLMLAVQDALKKL